MTAIFPPSAPQRSGWQTVLVLVLAFWFSGSLLLDALVMPTLYAAGMMTEPGFASAGYSLFWLFNRIELLCAAISLTCVLILRYTRHPWQRPGQMTVLMAVLLVAIAAIETYALTPSMSALGLQLNWFTTQSAPAQMNGLHLSYWVLDLIKLGTAALLLWFYDRQANPVSQV